MTLITVNHQELRPDRTGHPYPRVKVGIVNLGWTGDGASITNVAKQMGDVNGNISFQLNPSPAGTWYVWNHSDGINQSIIIVPASGGPYTLQSLLVTAPTAAADPATTQAAVLALLGNYLTPGNDLWLKAVGGDFGFVFTTITTSDSATGLPTAGAIKWPDGTAGAFTGTTDGANGYTTYAATWVGATTRTLTASGITYDPTTGIPLGPTTLVVS